MKKLIFITMAIIAVMTTSCSETEDFSDPKNLVGTTWSCGVFPSGQGLEDYEYIELKFISTTQLEVWGKEKNANAQKTNYTYTYSINNKTITITYSEGVLVGTIDNNSMTLTESGYTLIFTKK